MCIRDSASSVSLVPVAEVALFAVVTSTEHSYRDVMCFPNGAPLVPPRLRASGAREHLELTLKAGPGLSALTVLDRPQQCGRNLAEEVTWYLRSAGRARASGRFMW